MLMLLLPLSIDMLVWAVFAAALQSLDALKASCNMRLHNNGTKIGEVTFSSYGNVQEVTAFLQADPSKVTQGYYGLHVHTYPVHGFDCSLTSTGDHYNPKGMSHGSPLSQASGRHMGDFGNIRAGERGEINYQGTYMINPRKKISSSALLEPVVFCEPYEMVANPDESNETETKRRRKGKRGRKRGKTKGSNLEYTVIERDCYQPKWLRVEASVKASLFNLRGRQSIVGRAVVIHAHEDDQGNSGTAKSRKTGNAGKTVACCTLELV